MKKLRLADGMVVTDIKTKYWSKFYREIPLTFIKQAVPHGMGACCCHDILTRKFQATPICYQIASSTLVIYPQEKLDKTTYR